MLRGRSSPSSFQSPPGRFAPTRSPRSRTPGQWFPACVTREGKEDRGAGERACLHTPGVVRSATGRPDRTTHVAELGRRAVAQERDGGDTHNGDERDEEGVLDEARTS